MERMYSLRRNIKSNLNLWGMMVYEDTHVIHVVGQERPREVSRGPCYVDRQSLYMMP